MEIAILPQDCLKIKSKHAILIVDPSTNAYVESKTDKPMASAIIGLNRTIDQMHVTPAAIVINGPGEYEIGGIKINSSSIGVDVIYNPKVDGIEILLGKITSLEKMQHKLKEQPIVIAYIDALIDASFVTALATNVVIFYGELASKLAESYRRGNVVSRSKYLVTVDKLPQEAETVLLEQAN